MSRKIFVSPSPCLRPEVGKDSRAGISVRYEYITDRLLEKNSAVASLKMTTVKGAEARGSEQFMDELCKQLLVGFTKKAVSYDCVPVEEEGSRERGDLVFP